MKKINILLALLAAISFQGCACGTVEPGNRGVLTDLGRVEEIPLPEGLQIYFPTKTLHEISVRQQKKELTAPCFSSDLQEVNLSLAILYRIPESSVVKVFRDFNGEPFDVLIAPRVQESIKEATAKRSAETIVKERDNVKKEALAAVSAKVAPDLIIEDLVILDVGLSEQLTASIESKMVQEQEAAKARYVKQKADIDADTALVVAKGEASAIEARAKAEAESIKLRGEALAKYPNVIQLQLIQKWNGTAPQIVSGGNAGVNVLLPAAK